MTTRLPAKPDALGLPHRAPFVFVDEVEEIEAGEAARGSVTFSAENPIFAGHFPGEPLVPGVLLGEAIAQMAGIAAAAQGGASACPRFYLTAIRNMKFPNPAFPEEKIAIEVRKEGAIGGLLQFGGVARVAERVVAQGSITLTLKTAVGSGRYAQDAGLMRFASSARSTARCNSEFRKPPEAQPLTPLSTSQLPFLG